MWLSFIRALQYYLEQNMEARQKELDREEELEMKGPTVKAKSKMSKVGETGRKLHILSMDLGFRNVMIVTQCKIPLHELLRSVCLLQAEKELQKKQKAQNFSQSKAKGKASKNSKRWN